MTTPLLQDDTDSDDDSLLSFRPFKPKPLTASSQNHKDHPASVEKITGIAAGDNDTASIPPSLSTTSSPQKEIGNTKEMMSPSSTAVAVAPESDDEETGDPQQLALQCLESQNWNIPEAAKMITHPNQIQWLVRDAKKASFGRRTKKRKSNNNNNNSNDATNKIKKSHVLPCRIANDQEILLFDGDVGTKKGEILVQHLGIHRQDKNLMESVGKGRLIRFDGTVHLPTQEDMLELEEAYLQLKLSDDYLEGYRCTLKTMMRLTKVEQWMEAIMLQRILQSVQDNMANKIRLQQERAVHRAVTDNAEDDKAKAEYVESVIQERRANVVDDDYYSRGSHHDLTTTINKKKETLRVGDVIHYYPPELVAVDANLVRDVTIRGIDSTNPLCIVLSNGRGLGKDARIRRVFRILRGKLTPIEHPYDSEIDEYKLVNGGDTAIIGFGSMQSEAKALVRAQHQVQAEMKKLGYGGMEGLFHKTKRSKPEGTERETMTCRDPDTALLPATKNETTGEDNQKAEVKRPNLAKTKSTDEPVSSQSAAKETNSSTKSKSRTPAPLVEKASMPENVSMKAATECDGMSVEEAENDGNPQRAPDSTLDGSVTCNQPSQQTMTQSSGEDTEPTTNSLETFHLRSNARPSPTLTADDAIQEEEPTTLTTILQGNTGRCDRMAHRTGSAKISPDQALTTSHGLIGKRTSQVCELSNMNTRISVLPSTTSTETSPVSKITKQVSKQANRHQSNDANNDCQAVAPKRVYRRRSTATETQPALTAKDSVEVPQRANRRLNSEHLTKDQIELVDQVVAIMEQRWGKFPKGLARLLDEAELDSTFEYRVITFLQKDKSKMLRAAVHKETESKLRAWLQKRGGAAEPPTTADDPSSASDNSNDPRPPKQQQQPTHNRTSISNQAIRLEVTQHRSAMSLSSSSSSTDGKRRHSEVETKAPAPPTRNVKQRQTKKADIRSSRLPIRTSCQRQGALSTHMTKELECQQEPQESEEEEDWPEELSI